MINWQPIETAPDAQVLLYVPPHKLRDAVVFVGRASECRNSATHWAPINLPGELADGDRVRIPKDLISERGDK